jgi:20S proteasome subunit beta 6
LAVAGDDFCIVAADSRLSVGYSILSRTAPKTCQLTQRCVIASSGCNSDQV